MENMDKYPVGTKIQVMIEVEVTRSGYTVFDARYNAPGTGCSEDLIFRYSDIVSDDTVDDQDDTYKDPRGLVFEGTAEEFQGSDVASRALDYARQLTEDDNKTRTVLVVPGTSIDHALSFVDVGVRQVRHTELREEESRLNL